ncbi:hypothetical protein RQP46_009846 [Phenoliferia psychrophenolica]
MPKIWGFELSDMRFSAFSSGSLMADGYHLRKERIILYQAAMIICLAAECTATYSLSKYESLQGRIENSPIFGGHLYQNDIIDAEIVTIVFCVLVACLFGADFFFLAQFPKRSYPRWYQRSKLVCACVITAGVFVAAVVSTVVVARHSAVLSGLSPEVARAAVKHYSRPPLQYNTWAVNIAYVVVLWLGTVVMLMAVEWDYIHDPTLSPSPSSEDSTLTPPGERPDMRQTV